MWTPFEDDPFHGDRLDRLAARSAEQRAAAACQGQDAQRPALVGGGETAGLVPSKTSLYLAPAPEKLFISTARPEVAERRVKRLKRSVWASGHLHGMADAGHRPSKPWFVTLTYAVGDAWKPDHMSKAVQAFRNWCARTDVPCRYTWVAEIQPKRLANTGQAVVHYHLLAWLPVGVQMPKWDRKPSRRALPFWPHGMTNTQIAKAGVGYLMKYLSKLGELTKFPKGLRLYGIGGLTRQGRSVRAWHNLPEWVKAEYGVGDVKRTNLGLMVKHTGELLAPVFSCRIVPGGLELRRLRATPERFHDAAYSTFPRFQV